MYTNKQDALRIAQVFLNILGVRGVEVFGSVAREGVGEDLDIIVVVEGVFYASYVLDLYKQMEYNGCYDDPYSDFKRERCDASLRALDFTAAQRGWLESVTASTPLDLHLLPIGWRQQASKVQQHLRYYDPNFVSNIAKDAVTLKVCGDSALKRALWP